MIDNQHFKHRDCHTAIYNGGDLKKIGNGKAGGKAQES